MSLREWAPLTDLFARLPIKVQNGLFTYDIKLTCVDVLPEFLALGTNFGLVYWYDRKQKDLQKLRCENTNAPITEVKIVSTVDYMVACGNVDGNIHIFQVPKSHPESLPKSLRPKNKQIERYTVSELHHGPITALEWSKNGMKLFSGDKSGHLVLTEIDFYMHLCKSTEILNESYEVVQLSYYQQNLLVSTTYRSIICKKEDKWKVSQVGKKDRKALGHFGGTFYRNSMRPKDAVLYCTRPGLRIWMADIQGHVDQTLLFKDILKQRSPEAQLINPISKNLRKLLPQKEATFGILKPFHDNCLVTHGNDVVYILDPKELVVTTTISHLRKVLCVATHKDEIFILEGERSLIRLSESPEPNYDSIPSILTASNILPLTTSIKDLTHKLQTSSIISAIPTMTGNFDVHTDGTSVIKAEEAVESPQRTDKLKLYDKIAAQNFDDTILFKHKRHKKINLSIASLSSHEPDLRISKPVAPLDVDASRMLPDLRSPESIKHDIEYKENLLANVLCFDKIVQRTATKESVIEVELEDEKTESLKSGDDFVLKPFGVISPQFNGTAKHCDYAPQSRSDNPNSLLDEVEKSVIESTNGFKAVVPVCMNIPREWRLENVTLSDRIKPESVLELSDEWEII